MKALLALAATLTLAAAFADEITATPLDEAQKAAHKVSASAPSLADAPIAIDADLDKPHLIKGTSGGGAMIIPDKKLTAETLAAAGGTPVPVGQLWMLKATIAENGHPLAEDKTRRVVVEDGDKEIRLQLFLLGAAKNAQGTLDLIVFAKDKTPLLRVPLEKGASASQQLPGELSGRKYDEDSVTLTVSLAGQYQARLLLMKPAAP